MPDVLVVLCDECDQPSTMPPPELWHAIDKVLCRYCGHDLLAQQKAKAKEDDDA